MTDELKPISEIAPEVGTELHSAQVSSGDLEIRNVEERIIGARIVAWDTPADTPIGLESYQRGAFSHIDPKRVVLRLEHTDPPAGKGMTLEERADGAYMTFRVSKTLRGDEILTLASDGVTPGVSLSYYPPKTLGQVAYSGGQRTVSITKADLREVSTTWKPMHERTDVLFVRSLDLEEDKEIQVAEAPAQPEPQAPVIDLGPLAEVLKNQTELQERSFGALNERIDQLESLARQDITVPGVPTNKRKPTLGEWASVAIRLLKGTPVSQTELQQRALDDIVTPDNPGLVPDALKTDLLIGLVSRSRPFLESTTQVDAPDTGMSIVVPVISQHSTAAVQATEKSEVESTALKVTTGDFPSKSIFGAADVSVQMLRRADRSFMSLLMRDLGRAYARNADAQAIAALFTAGTTPGTANIDPENLLIGEAWENSMTETEEPPDTMWLSAKGVSAFINAKNDGSNAPLYFSLNAAFRVGTGPGGDVSALRPVYVPALDASSVDVMIGPSSGFAWAEDAPIELQADNPTLAGRDIALGGIIFFIPRYPAAFTTYDLGS